MILKRDTIELEMPGSFENIDLFQFASEQVGAASGFDEDACFWIGLALREAINNAILHGNRQDFSKRVFVIFTITPEEFEIRVRDEGAGFLAREVPDPTSPNNLMKTSGRGIFYIRNYMDGVDFSMSSMNGGEVRMFKRRPSSGDVE